VEVRRSHRTLRLADGTIISHGDRIGVLHLNNDRVVDLHALVCRQSRSALNFDGNCVPLSMR